MTNEFKDMVSLCVANTDGCYGLECLQCQQTFARKVLGPSLRAADVPKEKIGPFMATFYECWQRDLDERKTASQQTARQSEERVAAATAQQEVSPVSGELRVVEPPVAEAQLQIVEASVADDEILIRPKRGSKAKPKTKKPKAKAKPKQNAKPKSKGEVASVNGASQGLVPPARPAEGGKARLVPPGAG